MKNNGGFEKVFPLFKYQTGRRRAKNMFMFTKTHISVRYEANTEDKKREMSNWKV